MKIKNGSQLFDKKFRIKQVIGSLTWLFFIIFQIYLTFLIYVKYGLKFSLSNVEDLGMVLIISVEILLLLVLIFLKPIYNHIKGAYCNYEKNCIKK